MAIDFKTFSQVVGYITDIKKPVLLRGRHGIGKSELVYQFANQTGLPVVERRASQMTEGDLLGMPSPDAVNVNGEEASKFRPFAWLIEACTSPVVLFLDEIDRAVTEVRQGIFQLTDSRTIAGWTLHPETLIFGAINGGEDASQYQVGEMDPAELDRWTVFDVQPTVEDWLNWAKDNTDTIVWDFINQNRSHLEHGGDYEPNKVYPSRRSWKRLNDCLAASTLLEQEDQVDNKIYHIASAFVGFEAAIAFNDFVANYERQVTVEMILDDGKHEKVSSFGINDHCALLEKMDASDRFKNPLSEEQVQNLAKYFMTLPSEAMMKLWTIVSQGDSANVIALHKSEVEGELVSSLMVKMLTGKDAKEKK